MADVLKQTLYFSAVPDVTAFDNNGTGGEAHTNFASAAQTHDANDATLFTGECSGDFDTLVGHGTWYLDKALDTASVSGTISFIRMKFRAKYEHTGGGAIAIKAYMPRINGTSRGAQSAITASYADYSQDFATDPADSAAWTNAKLNAQTFGVQLDASTDSAFGNPVVRFPEFAVEVWGPDVQTAAPASAGALVGVGAAALVANLVALSCGGAPVATSPTDPTFAPGAMTMTVESAPSDTMVFDEVWTDGGRDPLAPANVDAFVDGGAVPIRIIRSDTSPFDDGSDATKTLTSSPGSWPNSGTIGFDFHGTDGDTSIDGEGPIAGIKLYVRLRARKDTNAVLNNFRTQYGNVIKQFVSQPTVWPMLPAAGYYETLATDLIPLSSLGQPFVWGGMVDNSIFKEATMGWRCFADYSVGGAFAGQFAQVECADGWLEVYGFNGAEPEVIALKMKIGDLRRVQVMQSVVVEE